MTTAELRQLDCFIAEHVMGWNLHQESGSESFDAWQRGKDHMEFVHRWMPTTDPAAAMMVLAQCTNETTATIRKQSSGEFCIWWTDSERMEEKYTIGKTLPMAICRFAHALFSTQAVKR